MRRLAALLALLAALLAPVGAAAAATPRASFTDVEDELMCTTCKIPLTVAESPQADRERQLIRRLIARGETKPQIKRAMVAQFGEDVLALPKASGFGLTAFVVPIGLVVALCGGLVALLPRWRRRGAAGGAADDGDGAPLSAADTQRLDDELARYAG